MCRSSSRLTTLIALSSGLFLYACVGAEERTDADPGEAEDTVSAGQAIAFDLGSALGSPVIMSSTCGAFNEHTPVCASSAAADHSYLWTAPYAGTFTFTTAGSGYDTVLQLLDPASNASLGCNDDANGTLQSSVTASLSAWQQVTIDVDGYSSSCGNFNLNIAAVAVPTTGLKLWVRADAGVATSSGNVSTWADQSGNNNNATMQTASRQPALVGGALNSKPVIRFNGSQSLYLTNLLQPSTFTVFVAGKNNNPTDSFSMILGPAKAVNNQLRWQNGTQALFVGNGNSMPVITSTIGNTRIYHALSARYNGSQMSVYRDGNFVSSHPLSTNGSWDLDQIGAWYGEHFLQGDIAKILFYNTAISDNDRNSVNSYLKAKYALP